MRAAEGPHPGMPLPGNHRWENVEAFLPAISNQIIDPKVKITEQSGLLNTFHSC